MSWDLDSLEARRLAEEYLAAMPSPADDDEWVVTDAAEHPWGWVISWLNKRAVQGSRTCDLYAGGGPLLVDRKTGRVAMSGSARPVEYYIAEWRAGRLADLSRPN